jgi:CheY-like chemotaxis protein
MRVLIIEDEKGMAELLKKGLEEENHRVALAFAGGAGHPDFDTVVTFFQTLYTSQRLQLPLKGVLLLGY